MSIFGKKKNTAENFVYTVHLVDTKIQAYKGHLDKARVDILNAFNAGEFSMADFQTLIDHYLKVMNEDIVSRKWSDEIWPEVSNLIDREYFDRFTASRYNTCMAFELGQMVMWLTVNLTILKEDL